MLVARHGNSIRGPSTGLRTPVYSAVATPLALKAHPENMPNSSTVPGVGASAIGRSRQWTRSSLIAWPQWIAPHTGANGLY